MGMSQMRFIDTNMKGFFASLLAFGAAASAAPMANNEVVIATFNPADATYHQWTQQNDPVMGGRSTGNWTISNGSGVFQGSVVDVPKLAAPGFIKATSARSLFSRQYPDV